jgi:hypothetical protein
MKSLLLSLFILCLAFVSQAQTTPQKAKRGIFYDSTIVHDNEIIYPVKGSFLVSESGFFQYRKVEYWIHDAEGKEIYYSNHAMRVDIKDPEEFAVMMDREYGKLMRKYSRRMMRI